MRGAVALRFFCLGLTELNHFGVRCFYCKLYSENVSINYKKMKKIILLITTLICFGFQNKITDKSVIDKLYVEALNGRLDLILSSGEKYIEINDITSRIKNSINTEIFKFLSNEALIEIAIKQKKPIYVYRMTHKEISKDTIDVNFSELTLTAKRKIHWYKGLRFKKATFGVACGGTNGYHPDFRFAWEANENKWEMIENKFIKKEK